MHPDKAVIVEDLQQKLNATPFLFVADYTGLTVSRFGELRNRLAGIGARCHVVKNTFLKRAAKDAGYPELGELRGQNAIVVGDKDVAAAAKVLKTFTAEFKKPVVRTGVVDRIVVSTEQIDAIADLPSREVLLGKLLGTLLAPASQLVRVLNEPASALARVLKAHAEQMPAPEGAPAPEAEAATPEPEAAAPAAEASAPEAAAPSSEAAAPAPEAAAPSEPEPAAPAPEAAAPTEPEAPTA